MKRIAEKYIGDKKFYKMVLLIAVPIMIQNGITNLVGLLNNIMVGQMGTEQMSGVAIVNQLMMVYNICIFGAVSGAGIFGAQFYGKGDHAGVRNAFRFKIVASLILAGLWILLFLTSGSWLIRLFLHDGSGAGDIEETFRYARQYLLFILPSMIPFAISQTYSETLRETGETILPMKAGIVAVLVNLCIGYGLIFGQFGLPRMGVYGAAIATVFSRCIECLIVAVWTHRHAEEKPFIRGAYRDFRVPWALSKQIIIKGFPLLINETLWSGGMAMLVLCYSTKGLAVVAGLNISGTISNLFNVVFIAMGSAISIIIGQLLGAGKMEEAIDTDRKMIAFSVFCCLVIGLCMMALAPFFPLIYNTTEKVQKLATSFIVVASLCMPLYAFMHACYFTLRSGGKTIVTFLFDSVYVWVIDIPLALILINFTNLPILPIYTACQLIEIIKCVIGYVLVKKGVWIQNIVMDESFY